LFFEAAVMAASLFPQHDRRARQKHQKTWLSVTGMPRRASRRPKRLLNNLHLFIAGAAHG
jgi:hypothetical protein